MGRSQNDKKRDERGGLRAEIQQGKPFGSSETEAILNLWRTHAELAAGEQQLLEEHGLSMSSYNVLRILRGAGSKGHPVREIRTRMVARGADVTRLVDRLEKAELVERVRSSGDRRVVRVSITSKARRLLGRLDAPLQALHEAQLGHLSERELKQLSRLLEKARRADAS
jgi:DNA-binding MarR family transcriptional regulator